MPVKRFGLAKMIEGEISTPTLWKVEEDIKIDGNTFIFPGGEVKRGVLFTPDIKQQEIKLMENVYLVPNIPTMLQNAKKFVDYTIHLREKIGYDKIFYAPGVEPHLIPIMVYLGYDVFDDSMEKFYKYSLLGKDDEGIENFSEFILLQVKIALRRGKIRELVESMADNKAKEILRYLDLKYYEKQERFWPIWNESLDAVSLDSLNRPDIRRWIERLKERYEKPRWAKHLLLIPCSARKPYSESKSHREMREHIKSTMHEVILTSPLALVPRELERFYPAQNYDIPVIGHWYEEEKKIIRDMLKWYLEKFQYENILSYLPESMRFLEDILRDAGATMIWGKNLEALERETRKIDYHVPWKERTMEEFRVIAKFQFDCCEELIDGANIKGRFPRINIWKNGNRVFGYNPEKGMLTLTEESARCLSKNRKYTVYIDDFYPEGDVFAVGVVDATPEIREGDEVAIVHGGELRGWGVARMSYHDMVEEKNGKAIKVRDRLSN
jgi:archaeosine synthase